MRRREGRRSRGTFRRWPRVSIYSRLLRTIGLQNSFVFLMVGRIGVRFFEGDYNLMGLLIAITGLSTTVDKADLSGLG